MGSSRLSGRRQTGVALCAASSKAAMLYGSWDISPLFEYYNRTLSQMDNNCFGGIKYNP